MTRTLYSNNHSRKHGKEGDAKLNSISIYLGVVKTARQITHEEKMRYEWEEPITIQGSDEV